MSAYHPLLLTRLLLYGYATGVTSSRRIERATHDDLAFRYLAADQHPDHDTIAAFRSEHLNALAELFVQALRLCQKAGLVKLGNVAIDGTKMMANASLHRSVSYSKLTEREQYWKETIEKMLNAAEQTDREEDQEVGRRQVNRRRVAHQTGQRQEPVGTHSPRQAGAGRRSAAAVGRSAETLHATTCGPSAQGRGACAEGRYSKADWFAHATTRQNRNVNTTSWTRIRG